MATKQFIEQAQAEAEAENSMNDLITTIKDNVNTSEFTNAVNSMGLKADSIEGSPEALTYTKLYHAYDDRVIPVPLFMVKKRLTDRFSKNDRSIPEKFRGKQVWFVTPQKGAEKVRPFLCRLLVDGTEETKAEMLAAGLLPVCSKPARFATMFEADEHFRMKHRTRWAAWQRHLDSTNTSASALERLAQLLGDRLTPAT